MTDQTPLESPRSARLSALRSIAIALYVPVFGLAFAVIWLLCLFDRLLPLPLPFPRHPAALQRRKAWCVDRLVEAGAIPRGARVTRYAVSPFRRDQAFRSALAEVTIDYDHEGLHHTFACVAKFASGSGSLGNQVISLIQRNGRNEVDFYRTLGTSTLREASLRVYYARIGGLAGAHCVLLERKAPLIELSEEEGAPIEVARQVATLLARFHARHWVHHHGTRLPKIPLHVPSFSIDFICALAFGNKRRTLRHLARSAWHHGNRPQTVIHGDARIGNVLFGVGADGRPTHPQLIDWQATRWGLGVYDLTYFMTVSLSTEVREAHEGELLRIYHAALVEHGVTAYPLDALRDDHLHSQLLVYSLLVIPLLGGEVTVDADNEARFLSGGLVWYERLLRLVEGLDTERLARHHGLEGGSLRAALLWNLRHPPLLNRSVRHVAREHARREARRAGPTAAARAGAAQDEAR